MKVFMCVFKIILGLCVCFSFRHGIIIFMCYFTMILCGFDLNKKQTQHERDDNCTVIEENDKIRSENKVMMEEALENVICSTCDGQKLRIENARLKEEVRNN